MIIEKDLFGGEYIEITTETPVCKITVEAEPIRDISDICASHRSDPFWLRTKCGKTFDDIPAENLFFAAKHKDGRFSLYYSLASIKMRTFFKGVNGKLTVSAINGDENVKFDIKLCSKFNRRICFTSDNWSQQCLTDADDSVRHTLSMVYTFAAHITFYSFEFFSNLKILFSCLFTICTSFFAISSDMKFIHNFLGYFTRFIQKHCVLRILDLLRHTYCVNYHCPLV